MARSSRNRIGKHTNKHRAIAKRSQRISQQLNATTLTELLQWFVNEGELFRRDRFHGNVKWSPDEIVLQALIWAWHESKNVTDAFDQTDEVCRRLKLQKTAKSYTSFMNALAGYHDCFERRMRKRFQILAHKIAGRFWMNEGWLLMGFDGSRATTPRSRSNEEAFCAPDYGNSSKAKTRRKKKAAANVDAQQQQPAKPAQPQVPQTWITMMWHMGLKLPWTWRLGPSNSCERTHVQEMLEQETFPKNTLFCGDAGFVGYPLWSSILETGGDFLVRVGANVHLLSKTADILQRGGGLVLCWPKGKMNSGAKPLRLRLVQVQVGKTKAWILTSVLSNKQLSRTQIVKFYKMRWGIEVEFRGLKQTLDKHTLRCRNSDRVRVELDWSIRAMAIAELMAVAQQIRTQPTVTAVNQTAYDPKHRSLANAMRALRECMRNLDKYRDQENDLLTSLRNALVQRYKSHTDKKARYRPANKDKKPLGDPNVRAINNEEREKLRKIHPNLAA
jgi:Transposase DDE domain